jgi:hypothetical protein
MFLVKLVHGTPQTECQSFHTQEQSWLKFRNFQSFTGHGLYVKERPTSYILFGGVGQDYLVTEPKQRRSLTEQEIGKLLTGSKHVTEPHFTCKPLRTNVQHENTFRSRCLILERALIRNTPISNVRIRHVNGTNILAFVLHDKYNTM